MLASFWSDFTRLLRQPLALEGLAAVAIFTVVLLLFRRVRRVAETLEKRRALADYVRGLDEFLRGDFAEAIATLERVLERDPENVEARIALGDCYRERGDAAEAKKHHHHVHKVFHHELGRNFLSLGLDELALRNFEASVEAFLLCLEHTPDERDAVAGLAQAYAQGGSPLEAARYLRQLYPDGPAPDMSRVDRREAGSRSAEAGDAALAEIDADGAVRFFTEALAFAPHNVRARTGLLRAAEALGDPERARALVEEHLGELRRMAEDEETLFEPAAARPARPDHADGSPVLLTESGEERTDGDAHPDAPEADEPARHLPALTENASAVVAAVESKTARYSCSACGVLARDYAETCSACGGVGTLGALDEVASLYLKPVTDLREALDEVEENAAFVQGLAHKASAGDETALDRLLELGAAAIYDLYPALSSLDGRRLLGARFAELGDAAVRAVRECQEARHGALIGGRVADEFAAAFYLALPDGAGASDLANLGSTHDGVVAAVLADPRVDAATRDAALERLRPRGADSVAPVVDALAGTVDGSGLDRAAALVREFGASAVAAIEKRYFQSSLLGLRRARKGARRTAADVLARSGLPAAAELLGRTAAKEKDDALRAHYVACRERAERDTSDGPARSDGSSGSENSGGSEGPSGSGDPSGSEDPGGSEGSAESNDKGGSGA